MRKGNRACLGVELELHHAAGGGLNVVGVVLERAVGA